MWITRGYSPLGKLVLTRVSHFTRDAKMSGDTMEGCESHLLHRDGFAFEAHLMLLLLPQGILLGGGNYSALGGSLCPPSCRVISTLSEGGLHSGTGVVYQPGGWQTWASKWLLSKSAIGVIVIFNPTLE